MVICQSENQIGADNQQERIYDFMETSESERRERILDSLCYRLKLLLGGLYFEDLGRAFREEHMKRTYIDDAASSVSMLERQLRDSKSNPKEQERIRKEWMSMHLPELRQ